jgi:hypothetical protein
VITADPPTEITGDPPGESTESAGDPPSEITSDPPTEGTANPPSEHVRLRVQLVQSATVDVYDANGKLLTAVSAP